MIKTDTSYNYLARKTSMHTDLISSSLSNAGGCSSVVTFADDDEEFSRTPHSDNGRRNFRRAFKRGCRESQRRLCLRRDFFVRCSWCSMLFLWVTVSETERRKSAGSSSTQSASIRSRNAQLEWCRVFASDGSDGYFRNECNLRWRGCSVGGASTVLLGERYGPDADESSETDGDRHNKLLSEDMWCENWNRGFNLPSNHQKQPSLQQHKCLIMTVTGPWMPGIHRKQHPAVPREILAGLDWAVFYVPANTV